MSRSVPSASEAQATFAATLFDEWAHLGLRDVVLSPGSRSTPLAVAASQRTELRVHVRLDERSAGFFAIGRALATSTPVAVVVTSGTAAAELHACVAEADLAFVPLIVVTADRPPELHGVGAPQVIDQHELYGAMVRSFEEPGVAQVEHAMTWRPLARRLWGSAVGAADLAGPVHLNAAFVEPLVGAPFALPPRRDRDSIVSPQPLWSTPLELNLSGQRVLCVVGRGAGANVIDHATSLNWVVLGDATAQGSLAHFDSLLRSDDFVERARPDVVVRLGGLPASKVLGERLREWKARTIAFDGAGFVSDPDRLVEETFAGLPMIAADQSADPSYWTLWDDASTAVEEWLVGLDKTGALNEPLVARAVVAAASIEHVALVVGSSMPVRDVEWWGASRQSRDVRQPWRQRDRRRGVDDLGRRRASHECSVWSVTSRCCTTFRGSWTAWDREAARGCSWSWTTTAAGSSRSCPRPMSWNASRSNCSSRRLAPHDLDAVALAFGHDTSVGRRRSKSCEAPSKKASPARG